ncbi:hypothetical protein FRC09_013641 [Ceratobasidium sp. 395]|nr:hypothetical protein FRC09_013641 [Ceratobasidium sp. 395]
MSGCVICAGIRRVGTKDGYLYTLRIEVEKYEEHEKDKQTISIWAEARFEEMEKWHKHSEELEIYLDKIDRDRELELEVLKAQRSDEIKLRLLEKGWTKRETEPSPQNLADWNRLVLQPKPLTDQIWNDLYPKLVPLLASNRIYYEHIDKEQRRRDRIARIDDLVITIRQASPPLIHVAPKGPLGSEDTSKPITSHDFSQHAPGSKFDDSGVEVEMPFPSIIELLTWPMINHLIEDDTSPEDVETKFNQIRKEFDQAVIKWRREVEQDLVNIWNAACIQHGEDMIKTRSSTESKGKAVAREDARSNTHTDKELAPTIQSLPAETLRHSLELPLPEFIFTFAKPDGTTTTDISSLSPNVQILLRTDATFNCSYFRSSYPAIIPDPTIPIDEVSEKKMLKERWRVKSVTQDVEGLTVIKALLTQMGRANATGAEMNAIGARFRCGQCVQILPQTWKQMVFHYVEEQSKWKQVQKKTKENSKSSFPFHNTHDLRHLNTKPFVHLMSPQAAAELANESVSHSMQEMMCKPCKSMGVEARYLHTSEVGAESPMVHHLHNEHDIHHDTPGTHFVPWRPVNLEHLIFGSSEPSDEENPDSNHDFIWDDD